MVTKSQNKLNYDEADAKIAAFDEWLAEQTEAVQEKVRGHIAILTKAIPNAGEKSAKILLSGVYLRVREVDLLRGPVDADRPLLVIVEDVNDG